MILTCPECASRYFVDDARVGPNGRIVRCAGCGHSWRAGAPAEAPLALSAPAAPEPQREAPLPERIRAEALEKKKSRQAVAAGVAWAVIGAGFAALAVGAVLFRVDVVRLWPKTASAYALARLPVNPTGLAIENIQGQPTLISGHAALMVSGVERNVASDTRPAMPVRVVLLDKSGRHLASRVYAAPATLLPAGAVKAFTVNFLDPPQGITAANVEFDFSAPRPSSAKAPPKAARPGPGAALARPAAGGPAPQDPRPAPISGAVAAAPLHPQDAKPIPANSPYALPAAAIQQTTR